MSYSSGLQVDYSVSCTPSTLMLPWLEIWQLPKSFRGRDIILPGLFLALTKLFNGKDQMHLGASSACVIKESPSIATFRVASEQ